MKTEPNRVFIRTVKIAFLNKDIGLFNYRRKRVSVIIRIVPQVGDNAA